jgi:hypothetical protein
MPFAGLQPGVTPLSSTGATGQSAQFATGYNPPPSANITPPPARKRARRGLWIVLVVLLVLVVVGGSLGAYFAFFSKGTAALPPASTVIGHAYFASSGLLSANEESNQGIADQIQIKLDNITPPQQGMSYYAWLVNDRTQQWNPLALGRSAHL